MIKKQSNECQTKICVSSIKNKRKTKQTPSRSVVDVILSAIGGIARAQATCNYLLSYI